MTLYRALFVLGLAVGSVFVIRRLRSQSDQRPAARPPAHPTESELDERIEDTFPASDPPTPHHIT